MTIINRGASEWIVPSTSTVGVAYIVKRVAGVLSCDCAAGYHRGSCKHTKAVAATLPQRGPSAEHTASIFMAHRRQA